MITDNYSMSPDGKLLAFWILAQPSPFEEAQLAVLDIDTGAVTNYCIKGDPFLDNAYGQESLLAPIWSPDSTQLLVISRPQENPELRRVVMVDIVNKYAAQINQDMEPVGWMVTP
jgi:Tol biopolymer transport system component